MQMPMKLMLQLLCVLKFSQAHSAKKNIFSGVNNLDIFVKKST